MNDLEADLERLENAMRLFFQTMKRPHTWAQITRRSGVMLDRPSALILQILTTRPTPSHVQALAVELGVEAPFVTRKTQELERAGYVRRLPDKNDRRVTDLQVTARGQAAARRVHKTQRAMVSDALSGWQPADRRQLAHLFERFSESLISVSHQYNHHAHHNQHREKGSEHARTHHHR